MDIVVWLRSLGLGQYEAVFRQNDIDETVLPNLTAEDLKELGVASLGRRRKLLDAIAALRAATNASPALTLGPAAVDASPRDPLLRSPSRETSASQRARLPLQERRTSPPGAAQSGVRIPPAHRQEAACGR
jgi:SAM (Sterile alpha motif) domain-containing protein